jgi:hypothetical protein
MSYNESTNVFGISSQFALGAGLPAVAIDRFSRIGIKTDAPNEALTINGNISANGSLSASGTSSNYFAGNVGIGTTAPAEKLTVSGNISANGSLSATTMFTTGSGNVIIDRGNYRRNTDPTIIIGANSDQHLRFRAGGDTNNEIRMTILSSGEVGIGTSVADTAAAKLTVSGNISASGNLFINSISSRNIDMLHTPANDGTNPVLRIGEIDFATGNRGFSGVFMSYNESTNVFGISSQFAPGAGLPVLSIDRFSNVGIDTDTPNEALTVNGNISSNATVMTNVLSARFINLVHTPANDGANPFIRIGETDNTSGNLGFSGVFMSYNEITNVFGISSQFAAAAATPALGIDRFGRTGVGTEASAERLTVAGNVSALSAVYTMGMQPIGFIPFVAKTTGFNLLGAVNTNATVYTVPGGMRAMATGLHIVITNASGTYTAGTMPSITLYAGSVSGPNQMIGLLALDTTPNYTAGRTSGTNSIGGNRNTSTSTIIVNIDTAAAGTSYTTLEATVYTFGYLIS